MSIDVAKIFSSILDKSGHQTTSLATLACPEKPAIDGIQGNCKVR
jgi:hypothetical protein